MKPDDRPLPFLTLRDDEFLPPINRWMVAGGVLLMGAMTSAIALSAILPYNITVKALATVRPGGELRLVQATQTGTITQIEVQPNQTIHQGQVMARLETTPLETQRQQLQDSLQQANIQLTQIAAQIQLIELQIQAEERSLDRSLAIAQAELDISQQGYEQQQATTQADVAEAEAVLRFAEREMLRYQQLVDSGAVSQLQLDEKQAAVQAAAAQLARAQAGFIPGNASVTIAQERIVQESSRSRAILANLERERESLIQQQAGLQSQFIAEQADLDRVEADLDRAILRATSDGILFQLNLRNPGQVVMVGDTIAAIAPQTEALILKAAVATQDINKIQLGQTVYIRLEACPFPDYGTLIGTVTAISPDAIGVNPEPLNTLGMPSPGSSSYFEVTIQPNRQFLTRTESTQSCPLQAGMRANTTIVAGQETVLQFVLRTVQLWTR